MPQLNLVCNDQNDLYRVLNENKIPCRRFDSQKEAVATSGPGDGILVLAADYPRKTTEIEKDFIPKVRAKNVRLFVEFPAGIDDLTAEPTQSTKRERAVIISDFFGDGLKELSLLTINDCHFAPLPAQKSHIVAGVVAGYDRAVFGLPEKTFPILFEHDEYVMLATTQFSRFITARYGPYRSWQAIWSRIFAWLTQGQVRTTLQWTPTVRPIHAKDDPLPVDFEKPAFDRGIEWHYTSRLIVHPSREEDYNRQDPEGIYPAPPADIPDGDGRNGMGEGYWSGIYSDGSQRQRITRRSDNFSETAMALAVAWRVNQRDKDKTLAANLMDYIYFLSNLQQGTMADPKHPSFGLTAWSTSEFGRVPGNREYLASDNRQLSSSVAASVLLDSEKWDEAVLKAILAVERVTGKDGFGDRMSTAELEEYGWRYYNDRETPVERWAISDSPSARFLMAYAITGYEPLLAKGKKNLENLMTHYPDKGLKWWNTVNSAQSNLLIALAWLVRVEDTSRHRQWLHRVAHDMLSLQQPCGAIRDDVGSPDTAMVTGYGPCRSNEEFGTRESVLLQQNGDPLTDMLYCNDFALIGLHEAHAATGETYLKDAEDRLAEFICRTQIRSKKYPYLDGGWFRSFDFEKWEYWGNSADVGWGSWSIETGWSQAWITTTLGLRQLKTSLWDICMQSRIKKALPKILDLMKQNDGSPWTGTKIMVKKKQKSAGLAFD